MTSTTPKSLPRLFTKCALAAAPFLVLAGCPAPPMDDVGVVKGTQTLNVRAADRDRRYALHIPAAFEFGVPMPVIVAFHPIGGNGRQFLIDNDWTAFAEHHGFIAVGPDGLGINPNLPISITNLSGWSATEFSLGGPTTNYDVLYFDALLADLSLKLGFPVDRVFITGHSEG